MQPAKARTIPAPMLSQVSNFSICQHQQYLAMVQGPRFVDVLTLNASYDLAHGLLRRSKKQRGLYLEDVLDEVRPAWQSSLLNAQEDVPFKPETDVYVTGTALAPEGKPIVAWLANLRVDRPVTTQHGILKYQTLLNKTLSLTGPRHWKQSKGLRRTWKLGDPEPTDRVQLRYELAYGGSAFLGDSSALNLIQRQKCGLGLTPDDLIKIEAFKATVDDDESYEWHPSHQGALNNPSGSGYFGPSVDIDALKSGEILLHPGPQIGFVSDDLGSVNSVHIKPAGWGPIPRFWSPRVEKIGTCDAAWKRENDEYAFADYPADFDPIYFQYAPDDQRIADYLLGNELFGLHGVMEDPKRFTMQLPMYWMEVVAISAEDKLIATWMNLDTVHIELDSHQVHLTWRLAIDHSHQINTVFLNQREDFEGLQAWRDGKVKSLNVRELGQHVQIIKPINLYNKTTHGERMHG